MTLKAKQLTVILNNSSSMTLKAKQLTVYTESVTLQVIYDSQIY